MDCIVNTGLLALCPEYRPLKTFIIQLALGMAGEMVRVQCGLQ
jgi:hypothetical protein